MTKYVVTGGIPLHGQVRLHGAKNAGFKAMIAALLADSPSTICGLGLISEIDFAKQIITQLGGKVIEKNDPHCLEINPANLNFFAVNKEFGEKSRASNLYASPLLAKFGKAILPFPGGDKIGRRPLERHFAGLEKMGAKIEISPEEIFFEAPNGLKGVNFRFEKNTHTGTEFLIMVAVKARGETILENAAAEPEVDDLIKFLNLMGAKIKRTAPRTIKIIGVKNLHGAKHTVMKDRNEAVTFICAALATKGKVEVLGLDSKVLTAFFEKIKDDKLLATNVVTAPYPGFMTDWQPLWATLMTQARGVSIVHETVYEKRFDYVPGLIKMGAKIKFFEPKIKDPNLFYNFNLEDDFPENKHAIKIFGPTVLKGTEIEVNDIRSGATALLAGLIASGETIVVDPQNQIKRGYENLAPNLLNLGARIKEI